MTKQKVALVLNLPHLQNLIKRDSKAYAEEFMMQKRRFESELEIFRLRPTQDSDRFTELVTFISHVAPYYKDICSDIPLKILSLLEIDANNLHPDVRAKLLQALILLRNRGLLDPLILLKISFRLISVQDKTLRMMLGNYIINDIKSLNNNKINEKLNKQIQALLFTIIAEDNPTAALKSVEILADLYRRRIWTDERTVNVIASACTSGTTKVSVAAMSFFLGIELKMNEDEDAEKKSSLTDINYHEHSKKTKKRARQVARQTDHNRKILKEREEKQAVPLFPAIQLLNNPHTLAERMLTKLRQSSEKFETKLLILNFVSRLIGCHKLLLLSFYSFIQRYLNSHQQSVTAILAYLIQACHDLVPPEDLMPVLKTIAHNFITERCSNEVLAVGINSVREIFARAPALLLEPDMSDFVQDLVMYGRKTHKSVMTAAHSLINLIRERCPSLLRGRDRGKFHDPNAVPAAYGEEVVHEGVEGIELLEAYERGDIRIDEEGEVLWRDDENLAADDDGDDDNNDGDEVGEEGDGWEEASEESGDFEEEYSDEEDDDEGQNEDEDVDEEDGWEDASSDAADDHEDAPQLVPIPDSGADDSHHLDRRRVLSSQDFEVLGKLKASLAQRLQDPKLRSKRMTRGFATLFAGRLKEILPSQSEMNASNPDAEDEPQRQEPSFSVEPDSLASSVKAHKSSKIERIKTILSGRTTKRFDHEGHAGGLTNKEKLRKKNFVMVRRGKRSVANKTRTSNSEMRYNKMHQKNIYGRDKRKRRRV